MGKTKTIYKYSENGDYICSYYNSSEAAVDMKCDESTIRKNLDSGKLSVGYLWSRIRVKNYKQANTDTVQEAVRQAKAKQRIMDINRMERNAFREYARTENAIAALNEELNKHLKKESMGINTVVHKPSKKDKAKVIVQVSDMHLNELIDLPNNHYDFTIASKRLQKYAHEAKKLAKLYNAENIVVMFTGDLLNSDRRLDEMMAMATNRSKAALIATKLLTYFILDLNDEFNVSIGCITGNESRIKDDWGWGDFTLSDNYDFAIFNMIKLLLEDKKGIDFIVSDDPFELVLSVNGKNLLFVHGMFTSPGKDSQGMIQQITGKYANKGVLIDYVIFGHVHFANVTDLYARSGSLSGNNIYSDRALNLITKPSQTIHVIHDDGSIWNMRMELHQIDDYEGYPIKNDLDAYHTKSSSKLHKQETIVKVVI